MIDNLIYNYNKDITIGYWKDLRCYLVSEVKRLIEEDDWPGVCEISDWIAEMDRKSKTDKLYVMYYNNGMGLTIKLYEEA